MPSRRSAGSSGARRRQRSIRVTVAVLLLVLAAVVVAGALASGSLLAVSMASVVALVAGCASTRIVLNELAQTRREAARDRALQADQYQRLFADRAAEHRCYATAMKERVAERDTTIAQLLGSLQAADGRADEALERLKQETKRTVELQERLDEISREHEERDDDGLAFWDGGEASTVVDMLAWEERVSSVTEADPAKRRHA
jgi:hypothetical protein